RRVERHDGTVDGFVRAGTRADVENGSRVADRGQDGGSPALVGLAHRGVAAADTVVKLLVGHSEVRPTRVTGCKYHRNAHWRKGVRWPRAESSNRRRHISTQTNRRRSRKRLRRSPRRLKRSRTRSTICWTRSTKCWSRTRRSSLGRTSRRAANERTE